TPGEPHRIRQSAKMRIADALEQSKARVYIAIVQGARHDALDPIGTNVNLQQGRFAFIQGDDAALICS
ncbi:MAG: hypothetical protein OXL38_08165, partial [Gammaproteobacteria bacterium]|nr:hypothetical protein [Gammaproteobacteria bacterium]